MVSNRWKKFTPFFLYSVVASGMGLAAVASEARPLAGICFLIVLGLLTWSLGEYLLHRFAFHSDAHADRSPGNLHAMHLAHHDDPQGVENLFISVWISAPTAVGYCLLAWAILGDWHTMSYLFMGLVSGYISYERLHYQAHHGAPHVRLFRSLKKYHLLHHGETPNQRFGVTSPLFDLVFGTFQPVTNRNPWSKRRRS